MGDINKWCPMCGAAPGEPCTVISGDPNAGIALWHDDNARKPGLRPGDPRPEPHFYRHNDHPVPVAIKDEPAGVGEARPAEPPQPEMGPTQLTTLYARACDDCDRLRAALDEALSYRRTGRMPQDVLERLRAALGDVAAGEDQVSALDQRAVESRGGEAEA